MTVFFQQMLPHGRYMVHQVAGEEGAFIPDFTVFISANGQTLQLYLE